MSTQENVANVRDSQIDKLEDKQESTVFEPNTRIIKIFFLITYQIKTFYKSVISI